jgi:hypothetical protein
MISSIINIILLFLRTKINSHAKALLYFFYFITYYFHLALPPLVLDAVSGAAFGGSGASLVVRLNASFRAGSRVSEARAACTSARIART